MGHIVTAIGFKRRKHFGGRGASRPFSSRPPLIAYFRPAVSAFVALLFFLGAFVPAWHQARASQSAAEHWAQLSPDRDLPEDLAALVCHHDDGDRSKFPADDQLPYCKKCCPLCSALSHLAPALANNVSGLYPLAKTVLLTFGPPNQEWQASHNTLDSARPRAPPLAF